MGRHQSLHLARERPATGIEPNHPDSKAPFGPSPDLPNAQNFSEESLDRLGTVSAANAEIVRKLRLILKFRDHRAQLFGPELFADPAWDMLLELFICHLMQHRLSVSAACSGARVPMTTGLRWIKALEERGLVQRTQDRLDGRRVFVSMTEEGCATMSMLVGSQLFQAI